jgi:PAS domain S-box-containing protein
MKFRKIKNKIRQLLSALVQDQPLEKKTYTLLTMLSLAIILAGDAANILLEINRWVVGVTAAAFVWILFLYFIGKTSENHRTFVFLLNVSSILLMIATWFFNAGFSESTVNIMMLGLIAVVAAISRKYRTRILITSAVAVAMLFVLQYYFPNLNIPPTVNQQHFPFVFAASLLYFGFVYFLLTTTVKTYSEENKKIKLVNDELRAKNIEIESSKAEAYEHELKFRTFFETAGEAIFIVDNEVIIECNFKTLELFRCAKRDVVGFSIDELSTRAQPDGISSEQKVKDYLQNAFLGVPQIFEWTYMRKDGAPFFSEVKLNQVQIGGRSFVQAIVRDITERKNYEDQILRSERLFREIWNQTDEGMLLTDKTGIVIMVNDAYCRIVGKQSDELIGLPYSAIYSPDFNDGTHGPSAGSVNETPDIHEEKEITLWNGKNIWVKVWNKSVKNIEGDTQVLTMFSDITDRKLNELKLQLQSSALEFAANGIVITDAQGVIEWVNPAFEEVTGYAVHESIGKTPGDLVKSGLHDSKFYKEIWDTISSGQHWTGEMINQRKNGSIYIEEQTITPLINSAGIVTHYIGIKQDVTEYKRNEYEVSESKRNLETIISNLPGFIYRANYHAQPAETLFLSGSIEEITGFSVKDLLIEKTVNILDYIDQEDIHYFLDIVHKKTQKKEPFEIEYRIITKSGKTKWLWERGRGVYDTDGSYLYTEAYVTDITGRKIIEQQMAKREKAMQALAISVFELLKMTNKSLSIAINEALRVLGVELKVDRVYLFENKADDRTGKIVSDQKYEWCRFGISSQLNNPELQNFSIEEMFPHWASILKSGASIKEHVRNIPEPDRKFFEVKDVKSFILVPIMMKGSIWGFLGFDQTRAERDWVDDEEAVLKIAAVSFGNSIARRRAEKKLLQSEERFRNMFEQSRVGMELLGLDGQILKVNSALCEIYGYSSDELLQMTYKDIAYPNDLLESSDLFDELVKGKIENYGIQKRFRRKNGSILWAQYAFSLVRREDHQPDYVIGVVEDITIQKSIEDSLKNLARLSGDSTDYGTFDMLVENLSDALQAEIAYIGLLSNDKKVITTLSFWQDGSIVPNLSYSLNGTPCAQVLERDIVYVSENVVGQFPDDPFLRELSIESYMGMPLVDSHEKVIGVIVALSRKQIPHIKDLQSIHTLFAQRTVSEWERKIARQQLIENEKLLRESQRVANLGTFIYDINTQTWNGSVILDSILGIDKDFQRTIEGFRKILHPDFLYPVTEYFQPSFFTKAPTVNGEYKIINQITHEHRWVHIVAEPELNEKGKPNHYIGTVQDITDKKFIEEALRESEERYRGLIQSAIDGYWVISERGELLQVNDAYCSMSGFNREELLQKKIMDVEFQEGIQWEHTMKLASYSQYESKHRTKNGNAIAVLVSMVHLPNQKVFLAFISNISERKNAEEAMKESEERYRLLVQTMQQGVAVHEIICDEQGEPVDYRFIEINESY